jgi:hypothetical protein
MAAVVVVLAPMVWWLLTKDARGAEIATVLGLPMTVLSVLVAWVGVAEIPHGQVEGEPLDRAARQLADDVRAQEEPTPTLPSVSLAPNRDPLKARDTAEKRFTDPRKVGDGPGFWPLWRRFGPLTGLLIGSLTILLFGFLGDPPLFGVSPPLSSLLAGLLGGLFWSLFWGFFMAQTIQSFHRVERHAVPMIDEASFRNALENTLSKFHYTLADSGDDFLQFEFQRKVVSGLSPDPGQISVLLDHDLNLATLMGPCVLVRKAIGDRTPCC